MMILCGTFTGMAQNFFVSNDSVNHPRTEVASQLAVGHANRLDTYLSPEKYRGTEVRFVSEVMRDSRKHSKKGSESAPSLLGKAGGEVLRPLTYTLTHEGELDILHNRADNAKEISGAYDLSYAAMRRFAVTVSEGGSPLLLYAGLMADFNLGFTYNTRNTANNPAQGYLSLGVGANVMAQYPFVLWNKHFRVNYEARMPFVGVMFSPNYGQSYYELFNEGNYDHNIVFTSIATFQLRQQLALDYSLNARTALRLGYLCDIRQATPNNLKQHHYFNAVTFGVVIKK